MRRTIIIITIFILGLAYAVQDEGLKQIKAPQFTGADLSIPKSINFQGYLYRDGNPMDTTMDMWFGIYDLSSGGSLLYQQTRRSVTVTQGWFTVIITTIPDSVFPVGGPTRYLEVKAPDTGPALIPRISLVSVGYSYHALKADTAEYAKVILPHSHLGESWTSATIDRGLLMKLDCNTSSIINCLVDSALNAGTGEVYGAQFYAGGTGTGPRYGLLTHAFSPSGSSNGAFGIYASGMNDGTGVAYGGNFYAYGSGTGSKFGVRGSASGVGKMYGVRGTAQPSSAATDSGFGVYGSCSNSGSGRTFGGFFTASGSGAGAKYGLVGNASAGSSVASSSMGVSGSCDHAGTGSGYGGGFSASGDGTGAKVGVSGVGTGPTGSSDQGTGVIGIGFHYGTGDAIGGTFSSLALGSGRSYGVRGTGSGSDDTIYGVYGSGSSSGSAPAFGVYGKSDNGRGGYFRNENNSYYALTAWNNTGTGSTVRGLYVQGHGYATGGWQTFLNDGGTGFSLVSPEMEIVTSGTGSLINGKADISFDPEFSRAVSEAVAFKVIITPTSDCNGVFVSKKSFSGFSVSELMAGKANATFDWIAIGRLRDSGQRITNQSVQPGDRR